MRLISLQDTEEGMVLGKSIYGFNNKLMLGAGFRLTGAMRSKLVERGLSHIYILEEGTDDIVPEDIISSEIRLHARAQVDDKARQVEKLLNFRDMSHTKVMDLIKQGYLRKINLTQDLRSVVSEILNDISSTGAKFLNSALFKSVDTYQMDHAINVTALSILIGKKYGFKKNELTDLALGAFLHDFGKVVIGKMSSTEVADDLMHEHPTFGYLIVSNSRNASPIVSQIVNQHHENQDGSGYPIGLTGSNLPPTSAVRRDSRNAIYRLAEICRVADAFDNIAMNPIDKHMRSPEEAVKELILGAGTLYNKHIVNTLATVVPAFPVGSMVKIAYLTDVSLIGYRGVVASIDEDNINKPSIVLLYDKSRKRIKPRLIDTSKLLSVKLELIL